MLRHAHRPSPSPSLHLHLHIHLTPPPHIHSARLPATLPYCTAQRHPPRFHKQQRRNIATPLRGSTIALELLPLPKSGSQLRGWTRHFPLARPLRHRHLLSQMISALYFINLRGEVPACSQSATIASAPAIQSRRALPTQPPQVVIFRAFRDDITKAAADSFRCAIKLKLNRRLVLLASSRVASTCTL